MSVYNLSSLKILFLCPKNMFNPKYTKKNINKFPKNTGEWKKSSVGNYFFYPYSFHPFNFLCMIGFKVIKSWCKYLKITLYNFTNENWVLFVNYIANLVQNIEIWNMLKRLIFGGVTSNSGNSYILTLSYLRFTSESQILF